MTTTEPTTTVDTWHVGRQWSGHDVEDGCPCPKEPCGLVDTRRAVASCPQHSPFAGKSLRQGHFASDCPAW